MDIFLKFCAAALLVSVICLLIEKKEKDLAMVLSICVCCCIGIGIATFLQPVVSFLHALQQISMMDPQVLQIILKVVGIGLLAEICIGICQDAGRSALGKMLQTSATALILWLSLPLFTKLMELVSQILGGL